MVTERERETIPRRHYPSRGHDPERRQGRDRRAVDEEVVPLVPEFIANRRGDARAIPGLVQAGLFEQVQRLGHNMKGCGVSYGFPRITGIGREMVNAARDGDAAAVLRLNDELAALLERLPGAARAALD